MIGASGFIGRALVEMAPEAVTAGRGPENDLYMDLRTVRDVPPCEVAYICAGANGARVCEGNQDAFLANVDGPIEVARIVGSRGGFTVWISSMSVEWGAGAYQRQKLAAETVLRNMRGVGIVRAGRVTRDNVKDLCAALLRVGRGRLGGVTRWGTDEIAYQK